MNLGAKRPPNGWALLPFGIFFILYISTFIATGNLSNMPISVAFMVTAIIALLSISKTKLNDRIALFCRGAGNETIMLMVVIFILAGAFAGTAKSTGAIAATVNAILFLLPPKAIMASIFIAACFISMAMGTSCGTIAALAPIAVGISGQTDIGLAQMLGVVIGGAMFGDNLSFISDITIVATRTQGCRMNDKFKVNSLIVIPLAILVLIYYIYAGMGIHSNTQTMTAANVDWLKIVPYLMVLISALSGANVMIVLVLGIVLSGIIGLVGGGFTIWDWGMAAGQGIVSDMGELIIVSLMAGGIFELVKYNGGIDWLIEKMTKNIKSKRGAELSIGGLVIFTDLCTANNTIALIISGPIAKNISDKFGLDSRKVASLLDTFSCFVQGIIPYGAQLLIASGLAGINPIQIVPYLYYPMLVGFGAFASVLFRYPIKYS